MGNQLENYIETNESIRFKVVFFGEEHHIQTKSREYRNLMVLLRDKFYTEGFGECNGMGRCGTCLVSIKNTLGNSFMMDRNEAATLAKFEIEEPFVHLACQVTIHPDLQDAVVIIL